MWSQLFIVLIGCVVASFAQFENFGDERLDNRRQIVKERNTLQKPIGELVDEPHSERFSRARIEQQEQRNSNTPLYQRRLQFHRLYHAIDKIDADRRQRTNNRQAATFPAITTSRIELQHATVKPFRASTAPLTELEE